MARSDIEKVSTLNKLQLNKGDVSKTARETGVPRTTLMEWKNGNGISETVTEIRQEQKRTLTEIIDQAAHALGEKILAEVTAESCNGNLVQKATAFAILIDKGQLLKGQPTARTENGAPGDYSSKLDELRKKREERQKAG